MNKFFKKISAFFSEKPDIRKVYDDVYNAELLKQAYVGIVPGMIAKAGYFAVEWLLYAISLLCFFGAWYVWLSPLDGFIDSIREAKLIGANDASLDVFSLTSLMLLFLPGLIFFILARVSRAKHIQLQKLAVIAKKIDEVEKNLTYRVEHKSTE